MLAESKWAIARLFKGCYDPVGVLYFLLHGFWGKFAILRWGERIPGAKEPVSHIQQLENKFVEYLGQAGQANVVCGLYGIRYLIICNSILSACFWLLCEREPQCERYSVDLCYVPYTGRQGWRDVLHLVTASFFPYSSIV